MASITNDYTPNYSDYTRGGSSTYPAGSGTPMYPGTGVVFPDKDWIKTNDSAWFNKDTAEYQYGYIPSEISNIPPIQGNPKGAGWLVSWAYKNEDPVCFVKSKSDMIKIVNDLMRDPRVIKESIIIHKISAQYKPKEIGRLKKFWAKEITIVKE